jgi:hypothetical protein
MADTEGSAPIRILSEKTGLFTAVIFRIIVVTTLVLAASDFWYNIQTRKIWCPALTQLSQDAKKYPPPTETGRKLFGTFFVVGQKYNCY